MKAFKYDETFFYVETVDCQIDPLQSEKSGKSIFLLPASSTFIEIPMLKDGERAKFNGEFWEIVKEEKKEKTVEEIKQEKRILRNDKFFSIYWRIERFKTQSDAGIETTDSKETYSDILLYLQYLRDYPDDKKAEWWEKIPLDFDEWRKK